VVRVDGRIVKEPGHRVEPDEEQVTVRGRPLPGRSALRYLVLNKPVGVLTTLSDPGGRRTVREFLPSSPRMYPVGRLDADTSGLLLLTNDGELAHRLMHPRYGVRKVYRARVSQLPTPGQVQRLRTGVTLEPGLRSAPAEVRVLRGREGRAVVEISVHEGRYHQVRRMCEAVGLQVKALHRSAYGPLRLAKMARGDVRDLTSVEIARLRRESSRPGGVRRPPRPGAPEPEQPMAGEEAGDEGSWSPFRVERDEEQAPRRAERAPRAPRERQPRASRERQPRLSRETHEPRERRTRAPRERQTHAPGDRRSHAPRERTPRTSRDRQSRAPRERQSGPPRERGRRSPAGRFERPGASSGRAGGRPDRSGARRFQPRGTGQSPRGRGRSNAGPRPQAGRGRSPRPAGRSVQRRGRRSPNR
jgi:23S rRNA pseudouridine2605 synthase